MAGDHQRIFEEIMNKLFQSAPPSKKPLPSRVFPMESVNKQCRPWDRRDLMRRLATFKAMTWFGKPKAISAVNCARRGWINIEMDVISCEACGARLLFSTPSSWTLQQVENAAAVFSLKLDNGHKMLCPWINNACEEKLSLLPPTPPPALVDSYKERLSALLRLTALPIISSFTLDYMKSPRLDNFLSQLSFLPVTLNNGISLIENPRSKDVAGASEDATSNMYYQAQKIISLCGWEPSLLSYVVNSEGQPSKSAGEMLGGQKNSPIIHASVSGKDEGENNNHLSHAEHQYDPASTVLDCRFCGARVGLWAFATVQRPLESFTVVSDPNGPNKSASRCTDMVDGQEILRAEGSGKDHQNIGSTSIGPPAGLKLTIAGGPPPTKQNFRPIVSFPIISRHLRAEFTSSSTVNVCLSSELSGSEDLQIDVLSQRQKDVDGRLVESADSLKRKRSDNDSCVAESGDISDPSHSKEGVQDVRNSSEAGQKCGDVPPESTNYSTQALHSLHGGTDDNENSDGVTCASQRSNTISEGAEENAIPLERKVTDNVEGGKTVSTTAADVIIRDSEACENNSVAIMGDASNSHDDSFSQIHSLSTENDPEHNHGNPSDIASCSTANANLTSDQIIETGKEVRSSDFKKLDVAMANDQQTNDQQTNGVGMALLPANRKEMADHALGNVLTKPMHQKLSEFDPIRQHRTFCPWIAPEGGESVPGWRLTLNALIQQERVSSGSPRSDTPLASTDEADDPIASIRKLFMSPATKRFKGTR